ncbi:MAG: hypothetical protein K2P79_00415 [Sphingomonas sp.]|nr:hypothetical protein [Sphingomonas sp.]
MDKPPEKTNWRRIGLTAAVLLVPGGFLLGGALAARRYRKGIGAADRAETTPNPDPAQP